MLTSSSNGFNQYQVSYKTTQLAKAWQNDHMYRTSYLKQNEQNLTEGQSSTEQFLQTKSNNLRSAGLRREIMHKPVENSDYIQYDYNNLFRTSYRDMSTKLPKLINSHCIPGYKGHLPGLKAENFVGSNITRLSKECTADFDKKRFSNCNLINSNDNKYNAMSKTHGDFWKKRTDLALQKQFNEHDYTAKLKDSGYSDNHFTFDKTGWLPHSSLNGDQKRSEYRIQFNKKKEIQYKGPIYSVGKLKKKEQNYKHT